MDTPIINPWLFYIADIADTTKVVAIIGFVLAVAWFFWEFCENDAGRAEHKLWKPIVVLVTCLLIVWIVPSSDTLYKMAVAKMLTPNNINAVTEYADSLANDATDAIESVMDYGVDRIYDIRNNQKAGGIDD